MSGALIRLLVWSMIGLTAAAFFFYAIVTAASGLVILGLLTVLLVAMLRVDTYSRSNDLDT